MNCLASRFHHERSLEIPPLCANQSFCLVLTRLARCNAGFLNLRMAHMTLWCQRRFKSDPPGSPSFCPHPPIPGHLSDPIRASKTLFAKRCQLAGCGVRGLSDGLPILRPSELRRARSTPWQHHARLTGRLVSLVPRPLSDLALHLSWSSLVVKPPGRGQARRREGR